MMKTTKTQRCDTYEDAVKVKKTAAFLAQQDFGGKVEEGWKVRIKVRIKHRKVTHYDVKTYRYIEPPKPKTDDGSVAQQERVAVS